MTQLLKDLARAKATFQLNGIMAALGIEHPASLCNKPVHISAPVQAQTASMKQHAAPVDARDGDDDQCNVCGDHHEGDVPRECETGDGV